MILIAGLVADTHSRARITEATGTEAAVVFYDSIHDLRQALDSNSACAVIAEAPGKRDLSRLWTIRRIAETHPFMPIIAFTSFDERSLRTLFAPGGAPYTHVIFGGSGDLTNTVDAAIERADTAAARRWVAGAMLPLVPTFAFRVIELFLHYDSGFPGSDEISAALECPAENPRLPPYASRGTAYAPANCLESDTPRRTSAREIR